ncbi:hypothetical protein ACJMK2_030727 [Sinanodonta woodiana]|uniref:Cytochrome P450 n=1 Tax=Sinanodonta woodiana TaxID=1069815 RepID=A0ABD3X0K5_SINWO
MEFTVHLMDLISLPVLLKLLAVFLIYLVILSGPRNIPPGKSKWNLIASFSFFTNFFKHQEATMQRMTSKYGNIFSMYMGNQLVVFISGYDNIYQVLVKQADVFSDRPTWLPYIKQMTKIGQGIIMNDGYSWKRLRQFTLQNLRDFGMGKSLNEENIFIEIDALSKALTKKEEAVEIKPLITCAISNVIHNVVFGFRFDYEDPEFLDIINTLNDIFRHPGILNPFDYFPLGIGGLIPRAQQLREQRKRVLTKLQSYVYNQIEEHEGSYDPNDIRDFVDLYIKASKEAKEAKDENDVFTKGNIFRVICDLFVAGSESTSTTLDWAFLYMIEYPDVQKKCQQEIQEVYGNKQIKYADRDKLKYVEATLMEIQRCATVGKVYITFKCSACYQKKHKTLKGYFIPENTVIITNLESSNMDSKYWDNPKEFRPERFLDESGELVRNPAFLPFSTGKVCPGETFAKMEMFLVVTNLLQRFTFYREREDCCHDLGRRCASTVQPTPYKLRAIKRT